METLIILCGYSFILTVEGILTRCCGECLANAPELENSYSLVSLMIHSRNRCISFSPKGNANHLIVAFVTSLSANIFHIYLYRQIGLQIVFVIMQIVFVIMEIFFVMF